MSNKDFLEFSPLAFMLIMSIYSVCDVLFYSSVFSYSNYVGLALILLSTLYFFTNRRIYKYIFGATLLVGIFCIIPFCTVSIVICIFIVPIQLTILPSIILFTWINKEKIKFKIHTLLNRNKKQLEEQKVSRTEVFKNRFNSLSDQDIDYKLNQPLQAEAIEALKQIKRERQNS